MLVSRRGANGCQRMVKAPLSRVSSRCTTICSYASLYALSHAPQESRSWPAVQLSRLSASTSLLPRFSPLGSRTFTHSARWLRKKEDDDDSKPQSDGHKPVDAPAQPAELDKGKKAHEVFREDAKKKEKEIVHKSAPKDSTNENGTSGTCKESNDGSSADLKTDSDNPQSSDTVQKLVVPEIYPQVMALPIGRRPLFPGFYKAVLIKDKAVMSAIQELLDRKQSYVGAFLLKEEDTDADVITDINQVHSVGVFAQITSAFPTKSGDDDALTAVLFPHRRIALTKLHSSVQPPPEKLDETSDQSPGNVTSFEPVIEQEKEASESPLQFLRQFNVSIIENENLHDIPYDKNSNIIRAVTSEIISVLKEISQLNPLFRDQVANFSVSQSAGNVFEEPTRLADFVAAVSSGEAKELQDALETLSVESRLQKALLLLKKELMNAQLQSKISKDVDSKIQKRQKEYYLMEQLKGIKRELGIESDGKDKLVEQFKEKASKLAMPENVRKVFEEEMNKLAFLEPAASEFNVSRNYLDWLTQMPWGRHTTERYDVDYAVKVLDEDHYGLKDVKDRVLEFVAVGKLRGIVEGKILCFVGPPGVGKTSIGKSIARALGRPFYRFSVGGLTDVAEIKGHRRTYVGAMPGKMAQALKKVQSANPLILIDEIDKIGRGGHQGDPSSALLELLDPEQNSSFLDHYLDVPLDLSTVLFICTANITDTIPLPLLDRLEVIELSGYTLEEKMAICSRYLGPTAKDIAGLRNADVELTTDAMELLIKSYCRESGVRSLKKQVEKIYRKTALQIVRDMSTRGLIDNQPVEKEQPNEATTLDAERKVPVEEKSAPEIEGQVTTAAAPETIKLPSDIQIQINAENLKDYVGPPIFLSDRLYDTAPPGVVMGLAWTSMGGSALYIESILEAPLSTSRSPHLNRTGHLGDVMKESSSIAYSFAKGFMTREFPHNRFFEKAKIHLHCPEGAVPKDGPSAGITMASSLLSLALDHAVDPMVTMTGELTLTGKVLRIGGLREKLVAGKRSGANTIIFPKSNFADWEDIPDYIKEGLTGVPVECYSEVFKVLFNDLNKIRAESLWQADIEDARKLDREHISALSPPYPLDPLPSASHPVL